ncbi:MAG: hypothetical protein U0U66_06890 [Cytophagaceae bacterium]
MKTNKDTIVLWFRIAVAFLFIVSAIFKIYTISGGQLIVAIPSFEKQLVDQGIVDWCLAPVAARAIIALELFLGFGLLQNHYFKKFILPTTILMLIGFCIHLMMQISASGNSGNCGCMGQVIPMTPGQAIFKNIITLGLLGYIYINTEHKKDSKHRYPLVLLLSSLFLLFYFFPWDCCCASTSVTPISFPTITDTISNDTSHVDSITHNPGNKPVKIKVTTQVDTKKPVEEPVVTTPTPVTKPTLKPTTSVFANYTQYNTGVINPDKGNKIICLFNVECDHCMETAKQIGIANKKQKMDVLILFWGSPDQTANFFKVAGAEFPYQFIDAGKFFRLLDTAPSPPRVVVLNNGNMIGDYNSDNFKTEQVVEQYNKYSE